MTKKQIKYWWRMLFKGIILLLPLIACVMSTVVSSKYGTVNLFSLDSFRSLSINTWYSSILNVLGFQSLLSNAIWSNLLTYPLYLMWVAVFDIIAHIFLFIPNFAHKLMGD